MCAMVPNGTAAVPLVGRRAVAHSAEHQRWDDARPDVKTPCRGAASGRRRHGLRPGSHVEQEEAEERNQGGGGVWSSEGFGSCLDVHIPSIYSKCPAEFALL